MENSLIVLIFIASIIYKIYAEYKKEMEKTAKRTPGKLPKDIPNIQVQVPVPKATSTVTKPVSNPIDYYNQSNSIRNPFSEMPEEVIRVQNTRMDQKTKKASINQPIQDSNQSISFDLRQAVIQAAILERPYK